MLVVLAGSRGLVHVVSALRRPLRVSALGVLGVVVLGTFVVINLFIAVVINNLDEAKAERLAELRQPVTQKEILNDLRETQKALQRLEARLRVKRWPGGTRDRLRP